MGPSIRKKRKDEHQLFNRLFQRVINHHEVVLESSNWLDSLGVLCLFGQITENASELR